MYNNIKQESGRSMVEMLGVLAIIGVLSVGGIAGYTTAMNKHRANEILNAASVRAMMITTQLAQGRKSAELSLAEFGEDAVQGVSFDKEYTDGAETFNLKLTWATTNPSVCDQIKNIVGENVTVDDGCTTFTYKNEFGSGATSGNCFLNDSCSQANCAQSGGVWCNNGCFSKSYCISYESCLSDVSCDVADVLDSGRFGPCMKSGKSADYCYCYDMYGNESHCTKVIQCMEEKAYSVDACDCITSGQPEDYCKNF